MVVAGHPMLLLEKDYFILISTGLGAIFGVFQLIIYAIYYRTTPKDEDLSGKTTNDVQLCTNV
ncbi:hypothetical protein RchiOBHm_Chr2g0131641 [Rosa chinensis]|uniref:SWEET sugar transporter n=1 Tax=Rosa chinensis TaxID=74649 RepID=A0A2P6RV41_ROSCH|nr:hypothetical protein RchiOBHm_Chr2g0131641 [Rosa chinensis]